MNLTRCFRCKPIEGVLSGVKHSGLRRSLGLFQLIILGLGAVIGVGILVLTGTAASKAAGPAIVVSFAISALAALCTGLCYAELAAAMPVAGSVYTYVYVAAGELFAWIAGCMTGLFFMLTMSAVAVGWGGYLQSLLLHFGIVIPQFLAHTTGTVVSVDSGLGYALLDLPSLIIISVLTLVLYRGMTGAAIINTITVLVKITILVTFVAFGVTKINPANLVPFIPENTGSFGSFGISGIIGGASMVFMAYCGFDVLALATQESKKPQRDIPYAIIISLGLAAITYMVVSWVMVGLVNYRELDHPAPVALAVDALGMPCFSIMIKVGAVAGLIPVMISLIYAASRLAFSMAKDGLLPSFMAVVDRKTRAPSRSIITIGAVAAILAAIVPLHSLVQLINMCIIISYAIVCIVCIYLRYSQPNIQRKFKCPLMPLIPICALALYAQMLFSFSATTYKSFIVIVAILLVVYFAYCMHHSVLQRTDSDAPVKGDDEKAA